jgi:glycosyltransferase involved in cell wall biosynthesis
MKIVHILVGKANPDTINGVNKVVHFLATEQHRAGHDVQVWGLTNSKNPPVHVHEYTLRTFAMSKLKFRLGRELKAALGELKPGCRVHFHGVFIPEFATISRYLRRRRIAYGVSPHGGFAPGSLRQNGLVKRIFIALFDGPMLAHADLVHAVCEGERNDIERMVPGARTITVPNGQDLRFLDGFVATAMSSPRPVFGFSGRLDMTTKGLDLLLEGFAEYKRSGGQGVLWVLGEGRDRPTLENMVDSLGLADEVLFLGARFKDEKLQALANMDLFVLTSRRDVMPTSCLEAAAMGKPLLVSKETNLGDYVTAFDAGIVLERTQAHSRCNESIRSQVLCA